MEQIYKTNADLFNLNKQKSKTDVIDVNTN